MPMPWIADAQHGRGRLVLRRRHLHRFPGEEGTCRVAEQVHDHPLDAQHDPASTGSAVAGSVISEACRAPIRGSAAARARRSNPTRSTTARRSSISPCVMRETSRRSRPPGGPGAGVWRLRVSCTRTLVSSPRARRLLHGQGGPDRAQRVAQLVGEHGQELVLATVRLRQRGRLRPQPGLRAARGAARRAWPRARWPRRAAPGSPSAPLSRPVRAASRP